MTSAGAASVSGDVPCLRAGESAECACVHACMTSAGPPPGPEAELRGAGAGWALRLVFTHRVVHVVQALCVAAPCGCRMGA